MVDEADVCLIVEGGYPYILGGVASWMDAFMRASPQLKFHVISISIASQARVKKYEIADNVVGITDVILDAPPMGRSPRSSDSGQIDLGVELLQSVLSGEAAADFGKLIDLVRQTGFGQSALLDSKRSWSAMERVYHALLPDGPLVDFFWSWRFLARSVLSIINTPLPKARVFHAVSTGYAGLLGAYAQHVTRCPYVVTEHGIYTNERRIELSVADWIYKSGASGFGIEHRTTQLRDVWLHAFTGFSRIAYLHADVLTTQYRANQTVSAPGRSSRAEAAHHPEWHRRRFVHRRPEECRTAPAHGPDDRTYCADQGHPHLHRGCWPVAGDDSGCGRDPDRARGRGSGLCRGLPRFGDPARY